MKTPLTFVEATSGPDAPKWWDAIHQEFQSLIDHGTWEMVSRKEVPSGYRIIGCRWVFKVKANSTLKARLVIKGYRQKKDIDYYETFAAVSCMDSVRIHSKLPALPVEQGEPKEVSGVNWVIPKWRPFKFQIRLTKNGSVDVRSNPFQFASDHSQTLSFKRGFPRLLH